MLKIEHLTKQYGDKKAVDDLCLHIHPGEIYGFIGHNGAGKTTTLKSIVGILSFDDGAITIDGVSVKENPLKCKKMLAYIPDNPDLYDYMTGIKYLNFIADIFEISSELRKEKIDKYELKLPTDVMFSKVHGDIVLHYSVYKNQKIVMLDTITPEEILNEGHQKELTTYKGVMVSKSHADKDMFKINLLNMMEK